MTDFDSTRKPEEHSRLGEALLQSLHYKGLPQVREVYFQNDTIAVAHDVSSDADVLPVGFVFGTGSNASLGRYNTQLSGQEGILPSDEISGRMMERGDVRNPRQLKVLVGGKRMANRVIAAAELMADRKIVRPESAKSIGELVKQGNGTILSQIASGEVGYVELSKMYPLTLDEYDTLRRSCRMVLNQAGQVIGVMVGSVVSAAGYPGRGETRLPVEGSVFWKGYNVKAKAGQTLNLLIPDNEISFHEASGIRGVSKLAMVHSQEKENK